MTSKVRISDMKAFIARLALLLVMLIGLSSVSLAQGITRPSIIGPTQTGVIQDLVGTGPFTLVISGIVYSYDTDVTEFQLRGNEITDADLEIGMVLRFSIDDGILQRVEVLGPNNLIEDFDSH